MAVRANNNQLQTEKSENKTCFVIMPFSDPPGYENGHFRSIYEYTFVPAIREAGYEPLRIDDNSVSNLIHGKMMNELVNAPMVLCDLSTNNPNVLYELGIRHAYDKPVVLVQEMGQDRIFDIGSITAVEYHRTRLYEEVLEDRKKITKAIDQTANAKNAYSIMSLVALQAAKPASGESVTSEDRLDYLVQEMVKMSRKMNKLEKRMSDAKGVEPYVVRPMSTDNVHFVKMDEDLPIFEPPFKRQAIYVDRDFEGLDSQPYGNDPERLAAFLKAISDSKKTFDHSTGNNNRQDT